MQRVLTALIVVTIIGLNGCKPRHHSSSLSEAKKGMSDQETAVVLAKMKAFAKAVGIHINSHPIYSKAVSIALDIGRKAKDRKVIGYRNKMEAINFVVQEMVQRDFPKIIMTKYNKTNVADAHKAETGNIAQPVATCDECQVIDPKNVPHVQFDNIGGQNTLQMFGMKVLLHEARLKKPRLSCVNPQALGKKSADHKVCYSFESCNIAIHGLSATVKVPTKQSFSDEETLKQVDDLWNDIRQDVQCLSPSTKRDSLLYMVDSRIIRKDFHKLVRSKFFYRPEFVPNNDSDEDLEALLRGRLRAQLTKGERIFIRPDDPNRVRQEVIDKITQEETWRPLMDWDFEKNVAEEDRFSKLAKLVCADDKEECKEDNIKVMKLMINPQDEHTVRFNVDKYAQQLASAYVINHALLYYLDRVRAGNDIVPWLRGMQEDVRSWEEWRSFDYPAKRPQGLKHVSPSVAFVSLIVFWEDEAFLPFRHEYTALAADLVRQFIRWPDMFQDAYKEKQTAAEKTVRVMKKTIEMLDDNLITTASQIGAIGDKLIDKEKATARRYDNSKNYYGQPANAGLHLASAADTNGLATPGYFHSMAATFAEYQESQQDYYATVLAIQGFEKEFRGTKLLEKKLKQLTPKLEKARNIALYGALRIGCLSYGMNENPVRFLDTHLNEPLIDCWTWLFRLYNWDGDFRKTEKGFTGRFPFDRVCRKSGPSPMSWRKVFEIQNNAKKTKECTVETRKHKAELIQLSITLLTMPLMGHLGGMATQFLVARLTNLAGSRILSAVATRMGLSYMSRIIVSKGMMQWSRKYIGPFILAGVSSFLSSVFFEVGTRILYSFYGLAPMVDKRKCAAMGIHQAYKDAGLKPKDLTEEQIKKIPTWKCLVWDWGHSITLNTFIFTGMAATKAISGAATARIMSFTPTSSWRYIAEGVPFMTTTIFFAHTQDIVGTADDWAKALIYDKEDRDYMLLQDPDQKKALGERYLHAALMTYAFERYAAGTRKLVRPEWQEWANKRGFSLVQPSGATELMLRAAKIRTSRILRSPKLLMKQFRFVLKNPDGTTEPLTVVINKDAKITFEAVPGTEYIGLSIFDGFAFFNMHEGHYLKMIEFFRLLRITEKQLEAGKMDGPTLERVKKFMEENYQAFGKELQQKYKETKERFEKYEQEAIEKKDYKAAKLARRFINHADDLYQVMSNPETLPIHLRQVSDVRKAQTKAAEREFLGESTPETGVPEGSRKMVVRPDNTNSEAQNNGGGAVVPRNNSAPPP